MAYTFLQAAIDVLQDSQTPLKLSDIWIKIKEKGLDKKMGFNGATPKHTLAAVLYTEIKKENARVVGLSTKPVFFGLNNKHSMETLQDKNIVESGESEVSESRIERSGFNERDLHPLFVKFAKDKLDVLCKTIYHEKSDKAIKGKNKWMHPDIVGIRFASADFEHKITLDLLNKLEYPKVEFFSFELKVAIDFGNLKESYFQAVSNSSWADLGYLVVFNEIADPQVRKELETLNHRFGIGVIAFGTTSDSFEVLFETESKEAVDLSMVDELNRQNEDFRVFVENVMDNMGRTNISTHGFDEIKSDEKLESYIKQKKIERF